MYMECIYFIEIHLQDLSLDFIFGYRGFDTRHNLLYTADGLVVYPAAGAGVVYNPLTRQQSFYLEHNDDIICVALNRNHKLSQVVATGQLGKTAAIHVWDCHTKQTLSVLQGAHAVGVSSVDFSCNGKLLLSVGLNSKHSITVWRWAEGKKEPSPIHVHVLMRDERRKEERSKQDQTNKAKQHSTPKAVTFPKKNELPQVGLVHVHVHTSDGPTMYKCTCMYSIHGL